MDFATALYNQLQSIPGGWPSRRLKLLNDRLESTDPRDAESITHLEQTVRAKFGIAPTAGVDWTPEASVTTEKGAGTIDWTAILAFIEAILPIILPLILPLFGS